MELFRNWGWRPLLKYLIVAGGIKLKMIIILIYFAYSNFSNNLTFYFLISVSSDNLKLISTAYKTVKNKNRLWTELCQAQCNLGLAKQALSKLSLAKPVLSGKHLTCLQSLSLTCETNILQQDRERDFLKNYQMEESENDNQK